jgi:hypothetical protein
MTQLKTERSGSTINIRPLWRHRTGNWRAQRAKRLKKSGGYDIKAKVADVLQEIKHGEG